MKDASEEGSAVGARWPELLVALFLMALAALVIADSLRVGTGWGDDGPRSGYFPFYIGLALLGASGWTALQAVRRWRVVQAFAEREQLRSVLAILLPMVVYVGVIALLGIYLASLLLIAYFMVRHGKHGIAVTAGVALGVPLAFYGVFERWFLVPLPKGPLEALLGL
jgi:putative tricarboxylic transport membrane protein